MVRTGAIGFRKAISLEILPRDTKLSNLKEALPRKKANLPIILSTFGYSYDKIVLHVKSKYPIEFYSFTLMMQVWRCRLPDGNRLACPI